LHCDAEVKDPPEQTKSCSTLQFELQPSPSTRLPSSQAWKANIPSPQIYPQTEAKVAELLQLKPASIWQAEEHPSPSAKLPSSHCAFMTFPSPQISKQTEGEETEPLAQA
jgi:hypothetical protein